MTMLGGFKHSNVKHWSGPVLSEEEGQIDCMLVLLVLDRTDGFLRGIRVTLGIMKVYKKAPGESSQKWPLIQLVFYTLVIRLVSNWEHRCVWPSQHVNFMKIGEGAMGDGLLSRKPQN